MAQLDPQITDDPAAIARFRVTAMAVGLAAGVMVILGSLLPWGTAAISFITVSRSSDPLDIGITVAIGLLVIIGALTAWLAKSPRPSLVILGVAIALLAAQLGSAFYSLYWANASVHNAVNGVVQSGVSPGAGIYVLVVGLILVLASIVLNSNALLSGDALGTAIIGSILLLACATAGAALMDHALHIKQQQQVALASSPGTTPSNTGTETWTPPDTDAPTSTLSSGNAALSTDGGNAALPPSGDSGGSSSTSSATPLQNGPASATTTTGSTFPPEVGALNTVTSTTQPQPLPDFVAQGCVYGILGAQNNPCNQQMQSDMNTYGFGLQSMPVCKSGDSPGQLIYQSPAPGTPMDSLRNKWLLFEYVSVAPGPCSPGT